MSWSAGISNTLEEGPLNGRPGALEVGVVRDGGHLELRSSIWPSIVKELAVTEYLPRQDGRGVVQNHEVDRLAELVLELLAEVQAVEGLRYVVDQRGKIDITAGSRSACRAGAEEVKSLQAKPWLYHLQSGLNLLAFGHVMSLALSLR
jgi:hypothetical protein